MNLQNTTYRIFSVRPNKRRKKTHKQIELSSHTNTHTKRETTHKYYFNGSLFCLSIQTYGAECRARFIFSTLYLLTLTQRVRFFPSFLFIRVILRFCISSPCRRRPLLKWPGWFPTTQQRPARMKCRWQIVNKWKLSIRIVKVRPTIVWCDWTETRPMAVEHLRV